MDAILTSPQQKGATRLVLSPPELEIQESVGIRCFRIPPATSTPELAPGALALNNADNNTAVGAGALFLNTTGEQNTAVGANALVHNDDGSDNNAFGTNALFSNVEGSFNNAHGRNALAADVDGSSHTAVGEGAMSNGMHAFGATAIGINALQNDDVGSNTATGFSALAANTTGFNNAALGVRPLASNIDGNNNTAIGNLALTSNVSTRTTWPWADWPGVVSPPPITISSLATSLVCTVFLARKMTGALSTTSLESRLVTRRSRSYSSIPMEDWARSRLMHPIRVDFLPKASSPKPFPTPRPSHAQSQSSGIGSHCREADDSA
jgi:hypothetical protein